MTAQDAATDRDALRAAGFDEYLAKPVDSSELVAVDRRLAGREEQ